MMVRLCESNFDGDGDGNCAMSRLIMTRIGRSCRTTGQCIYLKKAEETKDKDMDKSEVMKDDICYHATVMYTSGDLD